MNDSNCTCDPYIGLYKWQNKDIYFFSFRGPACNGVARYVDQEGNELNLDLQEMEQFNEEAEFEKTVWFCNEN